MTQIGDRETLWYCPHCDDYAYEADHISPPLCGQCWKSRMERVGSDFPIGDFIA